MKDEDKNREQLLYEMTEMRRRISELEKAVAGTRHAEQEGRGALAPALSQLEMLEEDDLISTQSIDLTSVFSEDVTSSGSFSFSGVDRTWFGKLLQALPIPALLVDPAYSVIFMNECCKKVSSDYRKALGCSFPSIFANPWVADEAEELLEKVFSMRLRESLEAALQINDGRIWGRLHMRSIRLGEIRAALVLVEDLTLEKEQLVLKQKHAEEIQRERDELEDRVKERTEELVRSNERLTEEITDRKLVEELLAMSEARYRLLVQNSPVGILSCNLQGDVTEYNPAVLNILGLSSREEAESVNLLTMAPLVEAGVSGAVRKCLESGEECLTEFPYKGEGDAQIVARLHAVPISGDNGEIAGVQAVVEDITERKRAQGLLLKSERLRALVEMASGVAHNFNNSLQVVAAYSQSALACLESGGVSEVRPLLEQIRDSARQTAQTVRRLQQFAVAGTAVRPSQVRVFDATEAVKEGVEKSKIWWETVPEMQGVAISLVTDYAPDCLMAGAYHEMVEVVDNLVKNAAEAMPAGGIIKVKTGVENDEVIIQVQDDGIGIPKKNVDRIFEPFWTTKPAHVGMGLAVSSGIIRRHNATVQVQSKERAGTRITIRVPHEDVAPVQEAERKRVPSHIYRVLLISEDESMLTGLEKGLKRLDQKTFVAWSGQMGLQVLEDQALDAVVCDLALPDMSGWDVSTAITEICDRKHVPRPPFILLSERLDQIDEDDTVSRMEVDRIAERSVSPEELLEIIAEEARRGSGQASFTGSIRGIDILEYVQLLLLSGQKVIAEISSRDGERGLLFVDNGMITHATCSDLEGEAALYRCLSFKGGSFSSLPWRDPKVTTINKPGELILLEAARLRDERIDSSSEEGL